MLAEIGIGIDTRTVRSQIQLTLFSKLDLSSDYGRGSVPKEDYAGSGVATRDGGTRSG